MLRIAQSAIFLTFALFAAEHANACSCLFQDPKDPGVVEEALESADIVFVGAVESAEIDGPPEGEYGRMIQTTVFVVKDSWKGETVNRITTRVNVQCCLCGFRFEEDQTYLIFAHEREEGVYTVSVCSLSRTLAEAGDIIRRLDEITE